MEKPNQYAKINHFCLILLTIIAVTAALVHTRPVVVPFVFSIFIYAAISPFLSWLQERWGFSRLLSVFITSVLFLGLSFALILLIVVSFENFFSSADIYKTRIMEFVDTLLGIAQNRGIPLNYETLNRRINELPFLSVARSLTGGIFTLIGNIILVIIFVIFFIAGESINKKRHPVMKEIQFQISQYISVKFLVSLLTGFLIGILLISFQVDLAFMFAVFTFLLNFIPNVGSIIATIIPLPVVLLQFGFGWEFVFILTSSGILQFVIGNILEPKWMGGSLNLHPVTVLFSLVFWGLIWGIPGMFLSVPITAFLKIIFDKIDSTKPLAQLLSGRLPE